MNVRLAWALWVVSLVAVLLCADPVFALEWTIQTVDNYGAAGWYSSLALDASGYPHICYYGKGTDQYDPKCFVRYASWNGSSWSSQIVDGGFTTGVGYGTSLALDSNGLPHITYQEMWDSEGHYDLKYASFDGVSWTKQTLANVGHTGYESHIALNASDEPRILFYDNSLLSLRYAQWSGGQWSIETVDSHSGTGSLALDAAGNPHVAYPAFYGGLRYATRVGGTWQTCSVDSSGGFDSSIAMDPGDSPGISHHVPNADDLKYASLNGTSWNSEVVESSGMVGWFTSLDFDPAGNPCIVYLMRDPGTPSHYHVKYAEWDGASWQIELVDPANSHAGTSLVVDSQGWPHITYMTDGLRYAVGVPEPATLRLLAAGLGALWLKRRRKA